MADVKVEYLACPIRQVVSRFGDKWSMLVLLFIKVLILGKVFTLLTSGDGYIAVVHTSHVVLNFSPVR